MGIAFGKVYSIYSKRFKSTLLVQIKPQEEYDAIFDAFMKRESPYNIEKAMGLDSNGVRDGFYTFMGVVQKDNEFTEATEAQLVQWKQQFGGM